MTFPPAPIHQRRHRFSLHVMGQVLALVAAAAAALAFSLSVAEGPARSAQADPIAEAAPVLTAARGPAVDGSGGGAASPRSSARAAGGRQGGDGDAPGRVVEPARRELTTVGVQHRLRRLGYLVGPADGSVGQQTEAAIMAFQRVHGLEVDGVVGPVTAEALRAEPVQPFLIGGADDRIEVDLDLQLVHVVQGGERRATLHASSGSGVEYLASSGNLVTADTPVGEFEIERRIHGTRQANLGVLHNPVYFHRGFAIHGSPSVPAQPASHGCVRITIADGAWLIDQIPDGMPVHLHGGEHVYSPPGQS